MDAYYSWNQRALPPVRSTCDGRSAERSTGLISLQSVLSLTSKERQAVLEVLNSERFVDRVSSEGYATLLDEGICLLLDTQHITHSGG